MAAIRTTRMRATAGGLVGLIALLVALLPLRPEVGAYETLESRWTRTDLGYASDPALEGYVSGGLQLWADASTLTFSPGRDIVVRVAPLLPPVHYDGQVAQANVQQDHGVIRSCEIRVDGAAYFALEDGAREAVMTHELGHCLGLDHSTQPAIMMNPYFYPFGDDDVAAIRALYGVKEAISTPPLWHRVFLPMVGEN